MSVQKSPNLGSHSAYSWYPLRKEFTYTISCDILAIQLTFDLMWYLLKFFKFLKILTRAQCGVKA